MMHSKPIAATFRTRCLIPIVLWFLLWGSAGTVLVAGPEIDGPFAVNPAAADDVDSDRASTVVSIFKKHFRFGLRWFDGSAGVAWAT